VKMTVMEWLREIFPSTFPKAGPPIIMTEFGPVTESARLQCAINMSADDGVKARVEAVLVKQLGVEEGMREARRRYPEAYAD
jgi:hypothetical protein